MFKQFLGVEDAMPILNFKPSRKCQGNVAGWAMYITSVAWRIMSHQEGLMNMNDIFFSYMIYKTPPEVVLY